MPLQTFIQTFTASGSWTAPNGLAGLPAVYAWGPSGTAPNGSLGAGSGGGGGGGIGAEALLGGITAGTVLTVTIGAAGSGTATTVTGGTVTVQGNAGGNGSGLNGGAAGSASSNSITFAGGAGGTANGSAGGGGGGSAGATGAGGAGGATGTAGAAGTGPAGLGGAAGGAGAANANGGNGTVPGSGPAGGGATAATAGAAAGGQAVIVWAVWVPPQPVLPRRYPARGRWGGPAAQLRPIILPGQIHSSGSLIIRRLPSSAVWGGYAASGGGAAVLPGQIQSSGLLIIRRITNTGGTWGGYAAVSNISAPPVIPVGPPPAIPTSGGTINPWIRTWRAIAPGDVPVSGAKLPKIHGRGYIGIADGHVEDVIHEPTPVAGPSIMDLAAEAAAAAARQLGEVKAGALDIGRIFADPPYQRHPQKCGAIRKVGGVMLTCGRKPGHVGKHSDRGLDWR